MALAAWLALRRRLEPGPRALAAVLATATLIFLGVVVGALPSFPPSVLPPFRRV